MASARTASVWCATTASRRGRRQVVPQAGGAEDPAQSRRQGIRPTGSHQQARLAVGDELRDATGVGSDHGHTARLRLQNAQPERLRVRRVDQHVERAQDRGHLVDRTHEAGPVPEEGRRLRPQLRSRSCRRRARERPPRRDGSGPPARAASPSPAPPSGCPSPGRRGRPPRRSARRAGCSAGPSTTRPAGPGGTARCRRPGE